MSAKSQAARCVKLEELTEFARFNQCSKETPNVLYLQGKKLVFKVEDLHRNPLQTSL